MTEFVGAILTGGASRRMGSDKALMLVDGEPLVARVAAALEMAGASSVTAIGGDTVRIGALGITALADTYPGEGPLGGIVQALADAGRDESIVVVVACDLPWLTADAVRGLLDAVTGDVDVAVACVDGHRQPVVAAWVRSVGPQLSVAFARGERSPLRVLDQLRVADVEMTDPSWVRDVDRPEDL